jgi:hypothetical protein
MKSESDSSEKAKTNIHASINLNQDYSLFSSVVTGAF